MLSSRTIIERAVDLGFDLAGIAPLGVGKDLEFSRQWVEKGFNGEMRYLDNPKRFDPLLVLPSAKSVICVGLVYNAPVPYSTEVAAASKSRESESRRRKAEGRRQKKQEANHSSGGGAAQFVASSDRMVIRNCGQRTTHDGQSTIPSADFPFSIFQFPTRAWISRYAWGRDYHEVMRAKLEQLRVELEKMAPGVETRVFVDTGPVIERAFARFSGIGWMGKNTCIINEEKGSWFFLGVILCSLELVPDLPAPDRCGSCTACLQACPTGALVEPYVMDASRCISYLTIELRGAIPEELRRKMGGNVFGCDICQDVCPWNSSRQSSVFSYQQAASPQLQPTVSPQSSIRLGSRTVPSASLGDGERSRTVSKVEPSAISDQQPSSQQGQPANRRHATHPALTKVPQFHPMMMQPVHPRVGEGSALEPQTTDHGPLTTDNRPRTTSKGPGTMDTGQRITDAASFSLFNPPLDALASLSEEDFRRIFSHSPIKRAKWRGWLRNLAVAMGNSGDKRFVPWLERAAQHSDPIVREHAAWALERLRGK